MWILKIINDKTISIRELTGDLSEDSSVVFDLSENNNVSFLIEEAELGENGCLVARSIKLRSDNIKVEHVVNNVISYDFDSHEWKTSSSYALEDMYWELVTNGTNLHVVKN